MTEPTVQSPAPHVPGPAPQDAGTARRRAGLRAGAADMVRSLLVILALVAGVVLLVPRPASVPRAAVDLASASSAAAGALGFAPAVGVPAGWTVTSARVRRDPSGLVTWSVNYLTPQSHYVGLEQARGWSPQWLSSVSQGGTERGTTTVGDRQWTQYVEADKQVTSLLLRGSDRSTLVVAQVGGLADAQALARAVASGL